MTRPTRRNWLVLIAIGLLFIFTPALILIATLEVLFIFGEVDLSNISPLEFFELYLVDLLLLILFAYGIYRMTMYAVESGLSLKLGGPLQSDNAADDSDEDRS